MPQLYLRTADMTVTLTFPDSDKEDKDRMVMPGDNVELHCELIFDLAVDIGSRFTVREGNRTGMFIFQYPGSIAK